MRAGWFGIVLVAAAIAFGCSQGTDEDNGATHDRDGGSGRAGEAGVAGGGGSAGSRGEGGAPTSTAAGEGGADASGQGGGTAGTGTTAEAGSDAETMPPIATGVPDLDGDVVTCIDKAPPDSFEPDLQWSFDDADGRNNSYVMPLVGNLTDDDGDGDVDLADVPDVVVVMFGASVTDAALVALDGATGALHWISEHGVHNDVTPALGDLDGDGVAEVVSITRESNWRVGHLIAFDNSGRVKWTGDLVDQSQLAVSFDMSCLALADLDGDGSPEILVGNAVYDARGTLLWKAPVDPPFWSATAAADLDGDGQLEVVLGNAAFHADGSEYFVRDDLMPGYPQIADFDGDGQPEIALLGDDGLHLLAHDGSSIGSANLNVSGRTAPAAVLDFDADGKPELAITNGSQTFVIRPDGPSLWSAPVDDYSGMAAATAFDFLGDGSAEVVYADEHDLYVFDAQGEPVYNVPRSSTTAIEYPVVADVDDDGSAEIVVVSNLNPDDATRSPAVQVYRDKQDRWIKARRIWNQHTYHVTNVYEDGRIPQHERPHWELLNTFRANAPTEGGELCSGVPLE